MSKLYLILKLQCWILKFSSCHCYQAAKGKSEIQLQLVSNIVRRTEICNLHYLKGTNFRVFGCLPRKLVPRNAIFITNPQKPLGKWKNFNKKWVSTAQISSAKVCSLKVIGWINEWSVKKVRDVFTFQRHIN